jgi:hypothetical protein
MRNRVFEVEYAGHRVRYSFLFPTCRFYFRDYINVSESDEFDIRITPDLLELGRPLLPPDALEPYIEYRVLISETARELLKYGCSIFHACAFVYKGYAWLLTGPSGIGKTTQFFNWQRMHSNEIDMITGDMPVLEAGNDGRIFVHSTSWCGKENLGKRGLHAPLAGIVLLEQGSENTLSPLSPRDAVFPFFRQFMVQPETEEQCIALASLMDRLLSAVPVWKLTNIGDNISTEMIRETFNKRILELDGGTDGTL